MERAVERTKYIFIEVAAQLSCSWGLALPWQ